MKGYKGRRKTEGIRKRQKAEGKRQKAKLGIEESWGNRNWGKW
jgi:hypothetical protein